MSNTSTPNPENASLEQVEEAIRSTANGRFSKRLEIIRFLLKGHNIQSAADLGMRSISTVRRYLRLYNSGGIDALAPRAHTGRPPLATADDRARILQCLDDPASQGETHWTLLKLHEKIRPALSKEIGYSTLTRLVRKADYRRLVPRPESPERNDEARADFLMKLHEALQDPAVPVWFMDEAGFLADPRPKAQWAKKGTKPVCPATGKHIRQSLIGAVEPDRGKFMTLIFSHTDTAVFQAFLDQFHQETEGQQVVMVLDNASWHKSKCLNWHNITPLYLAPYSPDLNPIERLWKYIKDHWFAGWYTKSHEKLFDRLHEAVCSLFEEPTRVQSVCRVSVKNC